MPLFLEPNQKYAIHLESDAALPEAARPIFFARSQSMRGQQRIGEVLDLWTDATDLTLAKLFAETCEVLGTVLVGWKNMGGIEYSKEKLAELLTYNEARELLRKVMYNQHVTADEKKSSELPP